MLSRGFRAAVGTLGLALIGLLLVVPSAHAWQVYYTNWGPLGTVTLRDAPWGTVIGSVPLGNGTTVVSDGQTRRVSGNYDANELWRYVNYGGKWGWSFDEGGGYDTYVFSGYTAHPNAWQTGTNGLVTQSTRPVLTWDVWDQDSWDGKTSVNRCDIQVSTDPNFNTGFYANGSVGAARSWQYGADMPDGTYYWRVRPYSWINDWGGWSGTWSFTVQTTIPTKIAMTAASPKVAYGLTTKLTWTVTRTDTNAAIPGKSTLQYSTDNVNWKTIATYISVSGTYDASVKPNVKTYYRALYSATAPLLSTTGSPVTVTPCAPTAISSFTANPAKIRYGGTSTLKWTLKRTDSGAAIGGVTYLQYYLSGAGWRPVATVKSTTGSFSYPVVPTRATAYRVVYPGASNTLAATSSQVTVSPCAPIGISLTSSPSQVSYGGSSKLTWTVKRTDTNVPLNVLVTLQASSNGTNWFSLLTTSTPTGTKVVTAKPANRTYYRVVFGGSPTMLSATSPTRDVYPGVKLDAPSVPTSVSQNVAFTVFGNLAPKHTAGASSVQLRLSYYNGSSWVLWKTVSATNSDYSATITRYSAKVSLPYGNRWWVISAQHPQDGQHVASSWVNSRTFLVKGAVSLQAPVLPAVRPDGSSATHDVGFTVWGLLSPKHPAGANSVVLQLWYHDEPSNKWLLWRTVSATNSDYSSTTTRYSATITLPYGNRWWCVKAQHPEDADHAASSWVSSGSFYVR